MTVSPRAGYLGERMLAYRHDCSGLTGAPPLRGP